MERKLIFENSSTACILLRFKLYYLSNIEKKSFLPLQILAWISYFQMMRLQYVYDGFYTPKISFLKLGTLIYLLFISYLYDI